MDRLWDYLPITMKRLNIETTRLPWLLLLLVLGVTLCAEESFGQSLLRTDSLCLFDTTAASEDIYTFDSDVAMEARVDSLTGLAGLDRNFVVVTANIPRPAAATVTPNRMLLYSQELFQTPATAATNWELLTVLSHQLGHLLLRHTLTNVPADRKREELEADRFAGTLVHAYGSTLEQSLLAYRRLQRDSRLYPSKKERLSAVEQGWRSLGDAVVTNFVTEAAVPSFPLPPPRASGWKEIPLDRLVGAISNSTLADVSTQLQKAFNRAGYDQLSFYSIAPQGFAIVTRVEQMMADGSPKPGSERFSVKISAPRLFSLSSYLQALLGPSRGHFRILAIVVSPVPLTYTPEPASLRHSIDWLWGGMTRLPDSIARQPLTPDYTCTALVYEFVQPSAFTEAVVQVPGSISAQEHLQKGGLWKELRF